jgi:hypothetical protein
VSASLVAFSQLLLLLFFFFFCPSLIDAVLGVSDVVCRRPAELMRELLALNKQVNLEQFLAHIYKTTPLEIKFFPTTMFAVE